jgi:hypothetical protein
MSFGWWSVSARRQAVLATRLQVPPPRLLTEHLQGLGSATRISESGVVVRGTDETAPRVAFLGPVQHRIVSKSAEIVGWADLEPILDNLR